MGLCLLSRTKSLKERSPFYFIVLSSIPVSSHILLQTARRKLRNLFISPTHGYTFCFPYNWCRQCCHKDPPSSSFQKYVPHFLLSCPWQCPPSPDFYQPSVQSNSGFLYHALKNPSGFHPLPNSKTTPIVGIFYVTTPLSSAKSV